MRYLSKDENEGVKKEPGRFEFNFPLLTFRTKKFGKVFNRLGSTRTSKWISWIALVIVPIVAAIGLFLLLSTMITLFWTPLAREAQRQLGPATYILLPGINPVVPIFYGWLALISAMVIHEGAHGIIARNRGFNVKSSGLIFFLIVPIGAFVDVDEDQISKAKSKNSLRVMAAGIAGNISIAIVCLMALIIIINGLTPVIDGVYVYDVVEDYPADISGILPGDVFLRINDDQINNYSDLEKSFENKNPGDSIYVTVVRGDNWTEQYSTNITLIESNNTAIMGVTIGNLFTEERLAYYQNVSVESLLLYMIPPSIASGLVPFSDAQIPFYTHEFGSQWHIFANIFFWIWFVNVNVAIFNALPIYPLDGGRMLDISLKSVLKKKLKDKTISKITYAITAMILLVLLVIIVIPFIM